VEPEPLVSREEPTGVFFVIVDIALGVKRIVELPEAEREQREG
jgi:hypothetical protein